MADVEDYLAALPEPLREIAERVRRVNDAELGEGRMWHGHPVWMIGATPVALIKAYTLYVTFGLFQGRAIDDESGRLEPGSREMASVRLRRVDDVDGPLFASWLRQANALARV
jgi:hypothetical protein